MNANTISRLLSQTKFSAKLYTSDGRGIYVDHPESVLIHPQVVIISAGANGASRVIKKVIFANPDHLVRIETTKRKPLQRLA